LSSLAAKGSIKRQFDHSMQCRAQFNLIIWPGFEMNVIKQPSLTHSRQIFHASGALNRPWIKSNPVRVDYYTRQATN